MSDKEKIGEYLCVQLQERAKGKKTDRWDVYSTRGAYLGEIRWYGAWRQYSFYPGPGTIFNQGCLDDLVLFLDKINTQHKRLKEETDMEIKLEGGRCSDGCPFFELDISVDSGGIKFHSPRCRLSGHKDETGQILNIQPIMNGTSGNTPAERPDNCPFYGEDGGHVMIHVDPLPRKAI